MKISNKDKKLLLYTGGILTLLLVYVWFFKPTQEANEALREENRQLETELAVRQEHEAMKDHYLGETSDMKAEIETTLDAFPAAVKEENVIMYADELEDASDIEIANISIGSSNQLYTLGQDKYLYDTQVGYTFTASYDDWKKVVDFIQKHDEKRNVENVVLSFDSGSARLIGSMNVNFYSMTGTEKVYEKPQVPNMPHGNDNIFGTLSSEDISGTSIENAGETSGKTSLESSEASDSDEP